uniref:Gamma-glutamyltransferase n=1 Tax=Timema genevievae TaxID=629358 RepID=A0A7R9PKD5_TIMGE|nr:unnamed protein product [Timema genevievae]
MSENHFDEYEHYNFEVDKHIYSSHSGKQRTKKEASEHTNHFDPSGHSRKIVTKLHNTELNRKLESAKEKHKSKVNAVRMKYLGNVCGKTRMDRVSDEWVLKECGLDILARNGSVVDAAIATMFCNGIITSQSMGIGGGFLMTLYRRDAREAVVLNARETAPAAATTNMFGDERLLAQNGGLAIGVPGEIRGYWEAHKKYGVLPWKELVAPAIKICEEGYNMTEHQYTSLLFREQSIHNSSILRGSHIRPGKICSTLRVLAEEGGDVFYNGSIARMLAQDIRDWGGLITEQDLRDYKVEWQEPVSVTMRDGNRLFSVPPPGSGAVIAFILNILEGYNLTAESVSTIDDTVLTFHRTTEAFKYGYARRTELGDPNFVNVTEIMKRLVSKSYARTIRRKIRDDRTNSNASVYGGVFYNQNDHGTSHISIVAPNGDAVSITSTVNLYFGSGVASEQTGVILNSGMDDFSSPNFNSFFGVPGSPANCIEPGKRSLSSMSPSIVVDREGDVRMVLGASGGTRITTAVGIREYSSYSWGWGAKGGTLIGRVG